MDISLLSDSLSEIRKNFWVSKAGIRDVSYPSENHEQQKLFQRKSFWYRHRSLCIETMFNKYRSEMLLDVGGSNGNIALVLKDRVQVAILEPGLEGAVNAEKNGLGPVIMSSFEDANFKKDVIGSIGLFDVLEHIEFDGEFLKMANEVTVPGGRIYITVPAYQFLWSAFDEEVGHFRRYRLRQLKKKVIESGFTIEYSTYIFSLLPIPILIVRKFRQLLNKKKNDKKDHVSRFSGKLLKLLFAPELWLIKKGVTIPFGSSCMIVAKKLN